MSVLTASRALSELDRIECMDALDFLRSLPESSVNCIVTSPPYFGLRDYAVDGQIGREHTPAEYVAALMAVFAELKRVLSADGTFWLNLGDSYANDDRWSHSLTNRGMSGYHYAERAGVRGLGNERRTTGLPPKSLIGIPWRVAFALQDAGWTLRSDIIWAKPNPMPESVQDRPTRSHEYVFFFSKSERYWYDGAAIREPFTDARQGRDGSRRASVRGEARMNGLTKPNGIDPSANGGRNARDVWTIPLQPLAESHFAAMPEELARRCILAGCPEGGIVLDPFIGAGTTSLVAKRFNRRYLGCDLNPEYVEMVQRRVDSIPYTLWSQLVAHS